MEKLNQKDLIDYMQSEELKEVGNTMLDMVKEHIFKNIKCMIRKKNSMEEIWKRVWLEVVLNSKARYTGAGGKGDAAYYVLIVYLGLMSFMADGDKIEKIIIDGNKKTIKYKLKKLFGKI